MIAKTLEVWAEELWWSRKKISIRTMFHAKKKINNWLILPNELGCSLNPKPLRHLTPVQLFSLILITLSQVKRIIHFS